MSDKKIADTLEELMKTIPYNQITVQMICKNVPISRNAFYYHFKNKQEVLEWQCSDYFKKGCLPYHKFEKGLVGAEMILNYIYDKKDFYRAIYETDGGMLLTRCLLKAHMIAVEEENVREYGNIDSSSKMRIRPEVFKNYAVSGVIGVLVWWIKNNYSVPVEEMAISIHTMMTERLNYVRDHYVY